MRAQPCTWFAIFDGLMVYSVGAANQEQRRMILETWDGQIMGEYPTCAEAVEAAHAEQAAWMDARLRNRMH